LSTHLLAVQKRAEALDDFQEVGSREGLQSCQILVDNPDLHVPELTMTLRRHSTGNDGLVNDTDGIAFSEGDDDAMGLGHRDNGIRNEERGASPSAW
jgi:hypothetical protein